MGILGKLIRNITKPVRSTIRGAVGESKVSAKLDPLLFGRVEHRQIDGLMLVDRNGISHQIDHVEIRENGIFCIETKALSGVIYGNGEGEYWTQYIGKAENRLYNPVKQNASHARHLRQALGGRYDVYPLVVMANNNKGKIRSDWVVDLKDMRDYLARFDGGTRLTPEEMDFVYRRLRAAHRPDVSSRNHVKQIRRMNAAVSAGICPLCGGKLTERRGQYGPFIGCSEYPKCKFTKRID